MSDWQDILMDEDPVSNPTVDLPSDNEKEANPKEASGYDPAGDLTEDDDPAGVKSTSPNENPNDEITHEPVGDIDDLYRFLDEDNPGSPTVDLPSENEKEGEKEQAGHEAPGALSEDDDPAGMKTEPFGEDEITGTKSTDYDDLYHFLDEKSDDDEEESDDDEDSENGEGAGEGESGDDDDDSDDDKKKKKSEKEDDDNAPVEDFASFFDDAGIAEPDGLPGGSSVKPAEPVDGDGDDISPIGEPNGLGKLTEPILEPVSSPAGGEDGVLKNAMDIFDEDPTRFFYGNF